MIVRAGVAPPKNPFEQNHQLCKETGEKSVQRRKRKRRKKIVRNASDRIRKHAEAKQNKKNRRKREGEKHSNVQ